MDNETTPIDAGEAQPVTRPRYEGLPVVVIAGRPNVGKSTLYNRLLHKRRAITDPTPGVTRDLVDSICELRESGRVFKLIDTGGFKLEREGLDELVVAKSLSSLEGAALILFLVDAMSITPEQTRADIVAWTPILAFIVALQLFNRTGEAVSLIKSLCYLNIGVTIISLAQYVLFPNTVGLGPKEFYQDSLTGLYVNRNSAGTFFGIPYWWLSGVLFVPVGLLAGEAARRAFTRQRTTQAPA